MLDLDEMTMQYREEGYSVFLAEARVCQDIVLKAISKSSMSHNVTIKGGVVMRSLTGNVRRATRDIDFDFIKHSIDEASIREFIKEINCLEGVSIEISGSIEERSQQEYRGKRVWVMISDENGKRIKSKMDLGVHKNVQIEQEEFCFDVCLDNEGVSLLINSMEQIFAEKLRALLKFGVFSGRVKDVFDLCFLAEYIKKEKCLECIRTYILDDDEMFENSMSDIRKRVERVFGDSEFRKTMKNSKKENWLGIEIEDAFGRIENCLNRIE